MALTHRGAALARHLLALLPLALPSVTLLLGVLGCAPMQRVPLDVVPHSTSIYLDGEPLADRPGALELRSDRAHVLFFRSEGYRPEQVVLRTSESGGTPRLEPAEVRVRLTPLRPTTRDLDLEQESAGPAAPATDRQDR